MLTERFNDELYIHVSKRKLSNLEAYAKIGKEFEVPIHMKKYKITPSDRRHRIMAVLYTPKIGMEAIANIITLSPMIFITNINPLDSSLPNISFTCPTSTYLKQLVVSLVTDMVLIISDTIPKK